MMTTAELKVGADTAWTMLTAFLVFFMNAGFGLIEADRLIGLRVSAEHEELGLDVAEMGIEPESCEPTSASH